MPGPRLLQHEGICCACAWAPRPVTAAHAILRHREKYNMFISAKSRIVAVSYRGRIVIVNTNSYRIVADVSLPYRGRIVAVS
jgi:hypothetical protein